MRVTNYIARYYRHVDDGGGYMAAEIKADNFLSAAYLAVTQTPGDMKLYAVEEQPPKKQGRRSWRDRPS